MASLPHLIAHEAYPGHHTEHCRKEAGLVAAGQREQTLFLVNTPQCLMAEGLADLALKVDRSDPGGACGRRRSTPIWGCASTERGRNGSRRASGQLLGVRQDAALLLHDQHRSHDDVAAYLERWALASPKRARQSLKFLSSPLWRAYISTYVEGYKLLGGWLDQGVTVADRSALFGRLLDETPSFRARLGDGRARLLNCPGPPCCVLLETPFMTDVNNLSLAELDPEVAEALAGELGPSARHPRDDRVRELRASRGVAGSGQRADQQVRRGIPGSSLLRRLRARRRRGGPRPQPRQGTLRRRVRQRPAACRCAGQRRGADGTDQPRRQDHGPRSRARAVTSHTA